MIQAVHRCCRVEPQHGLGLFQPEFSGVREERLRSRWQCVGCRPAWQYRLLEGLSHAHAMLMLSRCLQVDHSELIMMNELRLEEKTDRPKQMCSVGAPGSI